MTHKRVVLVLDPSAAVGPTLDLAKRWCPELTHLHVVWLLAGEVSAALEQVHAVFEHVLLDQSFEVNLEGSHLNQIAESHDASLVVFGPWLNHAPRGRAWATFQLVARGGVDVLSVGPRCVPVPGGHVAVMVDPRSRALLATAESVRALPSVELISVFLPGPPDDADEQLLRSLFRQPLQVELGDLGASEALATRAHQRHAALLVIAAAEGLATAELMLGLLRGQALNDAEVPVLVLHHDAVASRIFDDTLEVTDSARVAGQPLKLLLERAGPLGRVPLRADEEFQVVGSEQLGALKHAGGVVLVPPHFIADPQAPFALSGTGSDAHVASVQQLGARPMVLLDAKFPVAALVDVEPFARDHTIVVVRLRGDESLAAVRERFTTAVPWGGRPPVIDASTLLDDGGATDVLDAVDGVRLLRLGLRLLTCGWPVVALISGMADLPASPSLSTWTAASLRSRSPTTPLSADPLVVADEEARWRVLTGAALEAGHRVVLELDNTAARQRLVAAIAGARDRIHWQSYMVDDDPVAAEVVQALIEAASRGVTVRVLVDALYSLHEAFGRRNPLLSRLAEVPGVQVRAARPLSGLPRVVELKQRNHRKLTCVDGRFATITGRNLGAPYYRGFAELQLTENSDFHDVPWLDAGVALEGPLVEGIDRVFRTDWQDAGGDGFALIPAKASGAIACRLVSHHGLADAHSLDGLLELVRTAQHRLVVVNTFPPVLELQRAFLAAVRRGVQVQFLFGNVLPRWGDHHPFGNGGLRSLADELVRGRLEPVLRAGAQGFEFVVPDPRLGPVFTHVHAKLFVRDADVVAVGSANLDATSAYWESELMVLVHDEGFAARTLTEVDALLGRARPVELSRWKEDEARRAWLSSHWPAVMP